MNGFLRRNALLAELPSMRNFIAALKWHHKNWNVYEERCVDVISGATLGLIALMKDGFAPPVKLEAQAGSWLRIATPDWRPADSTAPPLDQVPGALRRAWDVFTYFNARHGKAFGVQIHSATQAQIDPEKHEQVGNAVVVFATFSVMDPNISHPPKLHVVLETDNHSARLAEMVPADTIRIVNGWLSQVPEGKFVRFPSHP